MTFAINILALILVLGLCWFAMVWLTGRFHGHGVDEMEELHLVALPEDRPVDVVACVTCEGVGANTTAGQLRPCPDCEGTGVSA